MRRIVVDALLRLAFAAAMVLCFFAAVTPTPDSSSAISDKIVHALAFYVLMTAGLAAFPRRLLALAVGLVLFGGLIELAQALPIVHRDSDILDVAADLVGVTLAAAPAWIRAWRLEAPAARRAEAGVEARPTRRAG